MSHVIVTGKVICIHMLCRAGASHAAHGGAAVELPGAAGCGAAGGAQRAAGAARAIAAALQSAPHQPGAHPHR